MYYVEILFVRIGVEYIQGRPCTSDSFGSNCGQIVHYIETKYLSVLQIIYLESEVSVGFDFQNCCEIPFIWFASSILVTTCGC